MNFNLGLRVMNRNYTQPTADRAVTRAHLVTRKNLARLGMKATTAAIDLESSCIRAESFTLHFQFRI